MLVSGDPLPLSLAFHFYTNNQMIRQDTNPNLSPRRQNRVTHSSCIHNRTGNDHNKEIFLLHNVDLTVSCFCDYRICVTDTHMSAFATSATSATSYNINFYI